MEEIYLMKLLFNISTAEAFKISFVYSICIIIVAVIVVIFTRKK